MQKSGARPIRATPKALYTSWDAAHEREPEPYGRRRTQQDDIPVSLGQRGPDEGQMPVVMPTSVRVELKT